MITAERQDKFKITLRGFEAEPETEGYLRISPSGFVLFFCTDPKGSTLFKNIKQASKYLTCTKKADQKEMNALVTNFWRSENGTSNSR